jgi:hypothetical protein
VKITLENISCQNCSHLNPPYRSTCENCKAHLRDRVVNLDLWATIGKVIEEPTAAFKQIIFSENKNFIYFFIFFIAIKNLIYARFFSVPFINSSDISTSLLISFSIIIIVTLLVFSLYAIIERTLINKYHLSLRFKDVFAANIYCFTPIVLSLFTVFPVEVIVLGGDLFSNNPYAFQIKPTISYFLIGFEFIVLSWTLFLLIFKGIYLTKNNIISILSSIFFLISYIIALFIASIFIFKI